MSIVKRTITVVLLLTVVGTIGLLLYSRDRTYFNLEDEAGNTTGNIYNGGLFCQQDDKIFFSNNNDDGSLYVMDSNRLNIRKIHSDKISYINADKNYIYYVRTNYQKENKNPSIFSFNNSGIYRINQNGKNLKLISNDPGAYLSLHGNDLYYQRYKVDTGLHFYSTKIDGTDEKRLDRNAIIPGDIIDDKIYYSGVSKNHNINILNLNSLTSHTFLEGNYAMPVIHGDFIYYLSLSDNYKIFRTNLATLESSVVVNKRCSTYNITGDGKFLYYQVDDAKDNKIESINLETLKVQTIMKGDFNNIHVTDHYVFFNDLKSSITYVALANGKDKTSVFNPPNLNTDITQ